MNLFANDKLCRAGNYENNLHATYPNPRALSLAELERDALVFYGPSADSVANLGLIGHLTRGMTIGW